MLNRLIVRVFCSVVCCCVLVGQCFESVCYHGLCVSFVLRAKCVILVSIVSRLSISCSCVILLYLSALVIVRAALFCKTWSLCKLFLAVCPQAWHTYSICDCISDL